MCAAEEKMDTPLIGTERSTVEARVLDLAHVLVRDAESRIIFWNRGAEQLYGYSFDEAIGKQSNDLLHTVFPVSREATDAELFETGEWEGELVHTCRDGSQVVVASHQVLTRDADGTPASILEVNNDITELRRSEAEVRSIRADNSSRGLVLDTANRVALDILASRTGVEALHHIAEAARILAGAQYAALGVARADGPGLLEFVTVGLTTEQERAIGPRPKGEGVLGLLLRRSEPLRLDMVGGHPASVGFPANHPVMESFLGVPIRRGKAVLGSLYLTNKQGGGSFTEADEAAVEALGTHAAIAIYNLRMIARQRALVNGLITAQEEERRAMAYELHDGLTQYVMASHAHLESFKRAFELDKREKALKELEQGMTYLKEAVVESRRLVNGLRMLALDDLGLAGAVEQLAREEKDRAGWEDAEFVHNVAHRRFETALETAIYRIAQEALTNARRHAQTKRVRVMLLMKPGENSNSPLLHLEVRDWGIGFVPEDKAGDLSHVGLQGMAERVSLMSGTHTIESRPGEGTWVKAVFPAIEPNKDPSTGETNE